MSDPYTLSSSGEAEEATTPHGYYFSAMVAALVMLLIVSLLMLWEAFVHALRHNTPRSLLPAVEYGLSEIGGLGFIGLLLEISRINEFLGEEHEELLEVFEFLHTSFFKVAIGYFIMAALMVQGVIVLMRDLRSMEQEERLPNGIDFRPDQLTLPQTSLWKELVTYGQDERIAEFLTIRHRFLQKYQLPADHYADITPLCAAYLTKLIHFSPLIWVPLIPFVALGQAIDMTRGAVSAESKNAYASVGYFYSTDAFWYMILLWQSITLFLGVFNFCTVVQYKKRAIEQENAYYADPTSQPESTLLLQSPNNDHRTAVIIPEWHLTLIQYHSWSAASFLVLVLTDMFPRDLDALFWSGTEHAGNPDGVLPETIAFLALSALNILQFFLTPKIFWMFCSTNFDKDRVSTRAIQRQLQEEAQRAPANH